MLVSSSALRPDQQLVQALQGIAWPPDGDARTKLQGHVCAFVDHRRGDGWSIEQVIVAIKLMAEEAGLFRGNTRGTSTFSSRDADRLITTMVTWCIEHYYRPLPE
jgi:hypothetical protein